MALKAHHRPATIPFHVNAGCLEIFDYDRGSGIFLKDTWEQMSLYGMMIYELRLYSEG